VRCNQFCILGFLHIMGDHPARALCWIYQGLQQKVKAIAAIS
jgi:hypothetical protein